MEKLLELTHISKSYSGVTVLMTSALNCTRAKYSAWWGKTAPENQQ
jgi:ABC-type sugar transport system ATPase subunit